MTNVVVKTDDNFVEDQTVAVDNTVVDLREELGREKSENEARSSRQADLHTDNGGEIENASLDDDSGDNWNDALIIGEDHPDIEELLQKPFVGMIGKIDLDDARNNTADGEWVRTELPLIQWLEGWKKGHQLKNNAIALRSFGLTRWKYAKKKGGDILMFADAAAGSRKDGAVRGGPTISTS